MDSHFKDVRFSQKTEIIRKVKNKRSVTKDGCLVMVVVFHHGLKLLISVSFVTPSDRVPKE